MSLIGDRPDLKIALYNGGHLSPPGVEADEIELDVRQAKFPVNFLALPLREQLEKITEVHSQISTELGGVRDAIVVTKRAGANPSEELIEREEVLTAITDRLWEQWVETGLRIGEESSGTNTLLALRDLTGTQTKTEAQPSNTTKRLLQITGVALGVLALAGSFLLGNPETRQEACETVGLCTRVCTNWILPC